MSNATNANKKFTCTYEFDGSTWGVEVWASTHEEAEMKLRAMGQGKVDGVVMGTIPAGGRCPTCGQEMEGGDVE
jgi:hypothetical protein